MHLQTKTFQYCSQNWAIYTKLCNKFFVLPTLPVLHLFSQNIAQFFCTTIKLKKIAQRFCSCIAQHCTKFCTVLLMFLLHKVLISFAQSIVHFFAQLYCVQMCFSILHIFNLVLHMFVHIYCTLNTMSKIVWFYTLVRCRPDFRGKKIMVRFPLRDFTWISPLDPNHNRW